MKPDIFHIGYPRTGTTYLQDSIFKQCGEKIYFQKSKVHNFIREDFRILIIFIMILVEKKLDLKYF